MTSLPATLQEYFTGYLVNQRRASPRTVASYRDAFCLLLRYAKDPTGREPSQLDFADLDAPLVTGFLHHLETERANSVSTRNARLAAIHSFYRFAAYRHPELGPDTSNGGGVVEAVRAFAAKGVRNAQRVVYATAMVVGEQACRPSTSDDLEQARCRRTYLDYLVAVGYSLAPVEAAMLAVATEIVRASGEQDAAGEMAR